MSDDDNTTSPVRKARDRALEAKLRYDQGRHGLAERDLKTLRRQWQTYLWHYYGHIAGHKHTRNIQDLWVEPIDPPDHPDSLAEIEPYQFATEVKKERAKSPFSGVMKSRELQIPAVWPADALRAIQAKLDECYHELGFDRPPKRVVKHSGYLGSEHPDWFSEDYTLDVWREFIRQVDSDGDGPDSLDDAIELSVGNVQAEKGGES
jgi:hypothetical protein